MTPEHKASLHDAREGDFILVEQESGYWYLLYISAFKLDAGELRVLIKSTHSPTKKDAWKYQQYGTWKFRLENWSRDMYDIRAVLRKSDILTLRPKVEVLRSKLGTTCLYEHCDRGLVRITPATQLDVHFRVSPDRTQARRARRDVKSICPFCMGHPLFEQHEHLATNPDSFPIDIYAQHILALNRHRETLDYSRLPSDVDLATLQPSAFSTPPPLNPALAWSVLADLKIQQSSSTRHTPSLSTHSYTWFKTAHERVINDVCGICRDVYAEGDKIADLPCLHFFHEACVREAFGSQAGEAKCPLCQCRVSNEGKSDDGATVASGPSGDVEDATRAWLARTNIG